MKLTLKKTVSTGTISKTAEVEIDPEGVAITTNMMKLGFVAIDQLLATKVVDTAQTKPEAEAKTEKAGPAPVED